MDDSRLQTLKTITGRYQTNNLENYPINIQDLLSILERLEKVEQSQSAYKAALEDVYKEVSTYNTVLAKTVTAKIKAAGVEAPRRI